MGKTLATGRSGYLSGVIKYIISVESALVGLYSSMTRNRVQALAALFDCSRKHVPSKTNDKCVYEVIIHSLS